MARQAVVRRWYKTSGITGIVKLTFGISDVENEAMFAAGETLTRFWWTGAWAIASTADAGWQDHPEWHMFVGFYANTEGQFPPTDVPFPVDNLDFDWLWWQEVYRNPSGGTVSWAFPETVRETLGQRGPMSVNGGAMFCAVQITGVQSADLDFVSPSWELAGGAVVLLPSQQAVARPAVSNDIIPGQ